MPLYGVRDVLPMLAEAPVLESLSTEPETLPGIDVLQVMVEIDEQAMQALLPKALHPTIPPLATFLVWRCPDGPFGPFTLAQVRVSSRAGMFPRGLLLSSFCDSERASAALRSRWGYNCRPAVVGLHRRYDRVVGEVALDGRTVLRVSLIDPLAISGSDIFYEANMNLVRVRSDGAETPRLIQVDPDFTFQRADRGRPEVNRFVPEALFAEGVRVVWPVSASICTADMTLPRIRFIVDPDVPATQSTERIA
jgi:hypothetical protein